MTAPVIPNVSAPVAAMLINSTTGLPYRAQGADVAVASLPIPNVSAPAGCTLIDPTTGVPYH